MLLAEAIVSSLIDWYELHVVRYCKRQASHIIPAALDALCVVSALMVNHLRSTWTAKLTVSRTIIGNRLFSATNVVMFLTSTLYLYLQ